jgi:hypothetical protein
MTSFEEFIECCGECLNHSGLDVATSFFGWKKMFAKVRTGSSGKLRAGVSQPVLEGIVKHNLSDQEAFFIVSYTATFSSWINLPLRLGEQLTECQQFYADGLDSALSKLPCCDSENVFRMDSPMCSKEDELEWFNARCGEFIRLPYFLSVAKSNWKNTDLTWRITTRRLKSSAADLNLCRNNPSEDELLYRRNSVFEIRGVKAGMVILEEADSQQNSYIELVGNYAGCI